MTTPNPLDAVKYCGIETQTDEEWARRKATAEALAPIEAREREDLAKMLDGLIFPDAPAARVWKVEGSDIIADLLAFKARGLAPYQPTPPPIWPPWLLARYPNEIAEFEKANFFRPMPD